MTRPSPIARRALLLVPFALLGATPALASAPKKKDGEAAKADPLIKLQAMALPIIADGRVINYVFVELSMTLLPKASPTVFEGKEPLLRDTLVRIAHRAPFTRPDSYVAVDEARLKAVVLREAVALVGPGKVASVNLIKQTPKSHVPPPRPAKA